MSNEDVICPYCKQPAELVRGKYGLLWRCDPCDAQAGVHENSPTNRPVGPLANAELRAAKRRAHNAFDPLWQAAVDRAFRETGRAGNARAKAYQWLADQLGIETKDCHFAQFNLAQCIDVVRIVDAAVPAFMRGA